MKVVEIAFVGYPVTDLKRARAFYEGILGLKVSSMFGDENMAWIEYEIGVGTLAIGSGIEEWKPSPPGASAALEVEDFDAAVRRLEEAGVVFFAAPSETPVCRMVHIADPDENAITIHKRKTGQG